MPASAEKDELITLNEASRLLKISRQTLYKWMFEKVIPYVKIGRRVLFSRNEVLNKVKGK